MELRFSEVANVPYIYIDEHHRVAFVNEPTMMPNEKYKWLTVTGYVLEVVKKGKKEYGGDRQAHKSIYMERSDITSMALNDLDTEIKNCKKLKKIIPALRKILQPFLDKNGLFPPAAMDSFNDKLQGLKDEMAAIKRKKAEKALAKAERDARREDRERKKAEKERIKAEKIQKKLEREEKKLAAAAAKEAKRKIREEKQRVKEQKQKR